VATQSTRIPPAPRAVDRSAGAGVVIVRGPASQPSRQGLLNAAGISAETAGARGLWLGRVVIPPGGRARAHAHANHETAIYVLQGEGTLRYGEDLQGYTAFRAGDFLYIGAGVPHLPANPSPTEPVVAIIARTDPHEQESVVLRPDPEAGLEEWEDGEIGRGGSACTKAKQRPATGSS
jgi:uncharacterized RmlC-like cupin family protein